MGIRVAYGKKENIQTAILNGAIPKDSIIFTSDNEDTTEIFFYDASGALKSAAVETGSGTAELKALAEKVSANADAIEAEAKERSDAEAGIMSLISQLAGTHSNDIEELKASDAALQTELEERHLTLKGLIDEMGLKVDSVTDRVGAVETAVEDLTERVGELETSGGTGGEVGQQISALESSVTTLEEEKLGKNEVAEVESDNVNDIFNDVFGITSPSADGDSATMAV